MRRWGRLQVGFVALTAFVFGVAAASALWALRTITRQAEDDFSSRAVLWLPMLLLDRMREGHAPPGHDGGDIVEAIERGRLATALERAGRIDEANAEWSRALHLWGGSDLQKFRSSIEAVSSVDSTAAQQAILGADQP
jgi:hypothetical protein